MRPELVGDVFAICKYALLLEGLKKRIIKMSAGTELQGNTEP